MPVKRCTRNNKPGKKYGDSGKCYTGKDATRKPHKQAAAINISQKKRGK